MAHNTEALKGAQTEVNDLRRQMQTLEIELESQRNLVRNTVSKHFIPHNKAFVSLVRSLTQHSHFSSLSLTLLT